MQPYGKIVLDLGPVKMQTNLTILDHSRLGKYDLSTSDFENQTGEPEAMMHGCDWL